MGGLKGAILRATTERKARPAHQAHSSFSLAQSQSETKQAITMCDAPRSSSSFSSSFSLPSAKFIPAHVQEWVSEIVSKQDSLEEVTDSTLERYNEIEAEVIVGGRRSCSDSADDEEGSGSGSFRGEGIFKRELFENKRAHRVACLLASARLLASLSSSSSSLSRVQSLSAEESCADDAEQTP
eukprot:1885979-Rhodomonas_salina.1